MDTKFHRSVGLALFGSAGGGLGPNILRHTDRLGTTESVVAAWGEFDFNRSLAKLATPPFGKVSPNVGLTLKELGLAEGNRGSEEVSRSNEDITRPALERGVQRFFEAYRANSIRDGVLCHVGGLPSGHLPESKFFLTRLHSRLERLFVMHLAILADDFDKRQRVEAAWRIYQELKDQGISHGGILIDNRSLRVRSRSLAVQDDQVGCSLAALLSVQRFNRRSPSLAEMMQTLAKANTFVGLSICVVDLEPAQAPPHWDVLRQLAPRLAVKGCGDLDDIVDACCRAAEEAITDRHSWCLDEPPDPTNVLFCVYCLPLRRRDRRWPIVATRVRNWLLERYNKATALFVSANGAEDPLCQSDYRLQLSLLYPLPVVPAVVRDLLPPEAAELGDVDELPETAVNGYATTADLPPMLAATAPDEDWEP